jgi:hypothetical protein
VLYRHGRILHLSLFSSVGPHARAPLVPALLSHALVLTIQPQLIKGHHFARYTGVGIEESRYLMDLNGELVEADFTDLSSTTIRTADATFSPNLFMRILSTAAGVILLYDVTSLQSFEYITGQAYGYACMLNQYMGAKAGERIRECVLVGTKLDIVQKDQEQRQVDKELADEWAQSQGMRHVELSTHTKADVEDIVRTLIKSIKRARERAREEQLEGNSTPATKGRFKRAFSKTKVKP